MTLVKFNRKPFDKSFNSLFEDFFTDMPVLYRNETSELGWKGLVPVNIKETDKNYSLEMVTPGFEKNDFTMNVDQNILTISAEKKNETKSENEKQIRKEYEYRSFKRSFTLDENIDSDKIEASYVNGILTLNLPKKEPVKAASKQITIS
ncbi:MAG: Hsp20/alpha crystallin family protein [Bacteroidetes bacterium]|nr:Hsp20/alpha crystallin family protein [Bacteroidota bacterium]MBS1930024.1 Hsp20/alpha crystallin family protein [Bacteroidota bacterium]